MTAVAQLVSLLISAVSLPLSVVLLFVAVTVEGRAFAAAVIVAVVALLIASFGRSSIRRRQMCIATALLCAAVPLGVFVMWRAPVGVTLPSARVHNLYPEGARHKRWALGNIVPESDQLMLGFAVMPLVDQLLTYHQAAPLKRWTREIYRELEADSDFRAIGSAMPSAYADLHGGEFSRHAFLYVPPTIDRSRPAGALLFLHGSGGNFKAYVWLLSKLADGLNLVVIAPSCGMGNWTLRETQARAIAATAAAQRIVPIDMTRVHAIGLSNGGIGVSHLLAESPREYRSFTLLSPVFHDETLRELEFVAADRKPVVFIVTGAVDDRVPLSYVENAAQRLKRAGAAVTIESFGDANHFLLFSHRDRVLSLLERWLTDATPNDVIQPHAAPLSSTLR